jgi:hypothetical protein
VATDNAKRGVWIGTVEVVDVAIERDRDKVVTLGKAPHLHVLHRLREGEGGDELVVHHVPQLACLVGRAREQLLRGPDPRDTIDAGLVRRGLPAVERTLKSAILTIVDKGLAASVGRDKELAVRGVPRTIDILLVIGEHGLPLERYIGEEPDVGVFTCRHQPIRTLLFDVDGVDLLRVTAERADRRPRVPQKGSGHILGTDTADNDPLRVFGPADVGDCSAEGVWVLVLEHLLAAECIPDAAATFFIA